MRAAGTGRRAERGYSLRHANCGRVGVGSTTTGADWGTSMASYKVSQLKHNNFDYVLIVVAPAFAKKNPQQQQIDTVVLQRCASRAGMKGILVPVWDAGGGRMGFLAEPVHHKFLQSLNTAFLESHITATLSCYFR